MDKCCFVDDLDQSKEIPLKSIEVTCQIKNTVANVSSKLTYFNNEDIGIEACFVFPMDEGAAVYHFEANMSGRRIVAECKKMNEAHDIYEQAVDIGTPVYMLDEDKYTGDIFKCRVGNLPPKTTAVLLIKYVAELRPIVVGEGKGPASQFVLPSVLIPRNVATGQTSSCRSATFTSSTQAAYDFLFSARVFGSYPIAEVSSARDTFKVNYINETHTEAEVILTSQFNRDHDFCLDIYYAQPFEPYIFWEVGASKTDAKSPVFEPDLMMINFLPHLPDEQISTKIEFVFLVDCSGSMAGSKMDHTRDAMMLFLKSLPSDCRFQLVHFGSRFICLTTSPVDYNETTLNEAVAYVERHLRANMGGTEILPPLTNILAAKVTPGWRRIVFILTDGAVNHVGKVLSLISRNCVQTRVFTLGVGEGASTTLVGGAARAGLGKAAYVNNNTQLSATVINLLRAALSPRFSNVHIEWEGLPDGVQAITIPSSLPPLFSDQYLTVFSLLIGLTDELRSAASTSSRVILTGQIDGIWEPIRYELPLAQTNPRTDTEFALRRLAAKYQIKEMTERPAGVVDEDGVVLISMAANLVSKFTAFVAVYTKNRKVLPGLVAKSAPDIIIHSSLVHSCGADYSARSGAPLKCSHMSSCLTSPFRELSSGSSRHCPSISTILASKQTFNGSWKPDKSLARMLEVEEEDVNKGTPDGVSTDVWWTAVVLAFLETRCEWERSEWIMFADKAKQWNIKELKQANVVDKVMDSARALFIKTCSH